ncbi:COX15/CtaA family protein [Hyphococcus flavus]|uniref:Heme A synthase n=1 Tax=Hyphococcus flavus TaxID=1866326 RepID=A0AAE9ZDZ4_9PROT|nr:COX15/CtaA family protein [Hyphococcus flavus]WDI30888.1 COX15/CtaA family protein [Hyphococcus flavus]
MTINTTASTAQNAGSSTPPTGRPIAIWLLIMCGLVAAMVIVGGATRLTDSGLSITEWRPVTGAIPPLNEEQWLEEFEKYKTIPEYEQVNYGMSLAEFKTIYWWEWGHRLLGRVIGAAFFFPMVFFIATGRARGRLALKLIGLFVLGGLQGALGWWMVTSGLADRIDVSQYRLAAHLSLAVILFGLMFWLALDLWPSKKVETSRGLRLGALLLAGGVFGQMLLGAFVAGLRAGRTFNTWPLMNGKFFPDGYFEGAPGLNDLFETIAAVQFNHRIGAYLLALGAAWFFFSARKTALKSRARLVLAAIGLQIVLGIWTILAATPISLGLLHQAGALGVFAAALYAAHNIEAS